MATILRRVGKQPNIADKTIQFDSSDEKDEYVTTYLPIGSRAMVLSPSVQYFVLNGDREWVEIPQQIWEELE